MFGKRLRDKKEKLDLDLQLAAYELDFSAADLLYVSESELTDAIELEAFNSFLFDLENSLELMALSDNAVVYEYEERIVILYTELSERVLLFERSVDKSVERWINKYK